MVEPVPFSKYHLLRLVIGVSSNHPILSRLNPILCQAHRAYLPGRDVTDLANKDTPLPVYSDWSKVSL